MFIFLGLFRLAQCCLDSSVLPQMTGIAPFSWPDNIPPQWDFKQMHVREDARGFQMEIFGSLGEGWASFQ